jgi:hypothetical protein
MSVEWRDRLAQGSPNAVVIDACGHHENEHIMAVERPCRHHFQLHRAFGRTVAVFADGPRMHLGRDMAERRDFTNVVKILQRRRGPAHLF